MKDLTNSHHIYFTDKEGAMSHEANLYIAVDATGCAPQYQVGQDISFGNEVDDKWRIIKINHRLQHRKSIIGDVHLEQNIFQTEIVVKPL